MEVNELHYYRKNSKRSQIKSRSKEDRVIKWYEYIKNLLGININNEDDMSFNNI